MLRRLLLILTLGMASFLGVAASAQAASLSGETSGPMNTTLSLIVNFEDGHTIGCGLGEAFCTAYIYELDADGKRTSVVSACGVDNHNQPIRPCHLDLYGPAYSYRVGDPAHESAVLHLETCNGDDTGCSRSTITFTPWPVAVSLSGGAADSTGAVEITLSAGATLPPTGSLVITDLNNDRTVAATDVRYAEACGDTPACKLTATVGGLSCAGPYFRAGYYAGDGSVETGIVRITGITSSGAPCSVDPDGGDGGSGGSGGGGGGGGGVPDPPRALLSGPSSFTLPDSTTVQTVTPSLKMDYPYEMVVYDTTDGNRVVGACKVSVSCPVRVLPDAGARQPVVHHLVSETRLGNDVKSQGDAMDVTVNPYPVSPRITKLGVTSITGGAIVHTRIYNRERRPGGYELTLWTRDPQGKNAPKQFTVYATCGSMDCPVDVPVMANTDGSATTIDLRSQMSFAGTVVGKSSTLTVVIRAGIDWQDLLDSIPTDFCERVIAANRGSNSTKTTVSDPAWICLENLTAKEAAKKIIEEAAKKGGEEAAKRALTWLLNQIGAGPGTGGGGTGGGTGGGGTGGGTGGGGTGGGTTNPAPPKVYTDTIADIARNLIAMNNSASSPELTSARATAIAKACLAAFAFHYATGQDPTTQPAGIDFCGHPDRPFWIIGSDVQQASAHDFDAIFGNAGQGLKPHSEWSFLNYEQSSGTKSKQPGGASWYKLAKFNKPGQIFAVNCAGKTGGSTGNDCDEYPYFSTEQGGQFAKPLPSLRAVNSSQNRSEGSLLKSRLYTRCGMSTGTTPPTTTTANAGGGSPFLSLPMPASSGLQPDTWYGLSAVPTSSKTFGICNNGGGGGGGNNAS